MGPKRITNLVQLAGDSWELKAGFVSNSNRTETVVAITKWPHTQYEQVLTSQKMSFSCPLAPRLSTKVSYLIETMKAIINLWMKMWGKPKHLFLICSDETVPPGVNICSETKNKTTSLLIICHNYAAHRDERISMIYLCHRKRVQLQTWKLPKPMRFKSMNDQRSKSLSTLFLNTETVSYGTEYRLQ